MTQQYRVKIDKVIPQTDESNAYLFVPKDHGNGDIFDYDIGQFFILEAEVERENKKGKIVQETDKRPYSIVSNPMNKEHIELLIKEEFDKDDWEAKSMQGREKLLRLLLNISWNSTRKEMSVCSLVLTVIS